MKQAKHFTLRDVAEFTGMMAIVASLVFVGLQLKQGQDIAIASQYHDRTALAVENFNAQLESGDLKFWARLSRLKKAPNLTDEDIGRLFLTGSAYLVMADNHYYQYQAGFMDEEAWQYQRSTLKSVLARPLSPATVAWGSSNTNRRASFGQLVETLRKEIAAENTSQ